MSLTDLVWLPRNRPEITSRQAAFPEVVGTRRVP